MSVFPARLRLLREKVGLTQEALSLRLGLPRSTVGACESGATQPGMEALVKIADHFDCQVDFLVGRSSELPLVLKEPLQWAGDVKDDLALLDLPGRRAMLALLKGLRRRQAAGREAAAEVRETIRIGKAEAYLASRAARTGATGSGDPDGDG
jgi:DNA-binding XRE family transcriptional regulator